MTSPEPDVQPINEVLWNKLCNDVELSRIYATTAELIDDFNNCINHGYDYADIKEQFEWLIEHHND